MRGKGITYDTGVLSAGTSTHEPFDPEVVRREMRIIHDDLHCNAVRVTGGYADRLKIAATHAAAAGLEVWLCPFTNGVTQGELLDLLADCADHAEQLRRDGEEVVLLTGSELSLFIVGFLPGETLEERLALVADPLRLRPMIGDVRAGINDFLRRAVDVVRARFGGKVSYASLPLEGVDWAPFDIISTDAAYRTKATAAHFRDNIRAFVAQGRAQRKPIAITEFGCTTHRGAAAGGGDSLVEGAIIVWGDDGRPARLNGEYVRDEEEQATYLREVLEVFEAEGVDNAFVNTFARYDLPHSSDPREDFDMASFGVVKVLGDGARGQRYPDMPWEPKAAFTTLADCYGR
jgi:hypothetical protein